MIAGAWTNILRPQLAQEAVAVQLGHVDIDHIEVEGACSVFQASMPLTASSTT
jgi:hypothetical protein